MLENALLKELQKLRESSRYAVAQGDSYEIDAFKQYMHVERNVEKKLKEIIIKCSTSENAQLILLCGNVGDGKSHMLSHLHKELSNELSKFFIHNDATESHNPNETSNDTLYKLLFDFKDTRFQSAKQKVILAINLGTLSKFLDRYEDEFTSLKAYIQTNSILDIDIVDNEIFNDKSCFHHINFTDYQMYSLTNDGPKSEVISQFLSKVISTSEENPIYQGYLKHKANFPVSLLCPILYNYEFLFEEQNRNVITELIIKAIVESKEIVSVRSLLNFIYDIIVPINLSDISQDSYNDYIGKMSIEYFFSSIIPSYLFEHGELSSLMEKFVYLDPCSQRTAELDDVLLKLINSENPLDIFKENIKLEYFKNFKVKIDKKVSRRELSRLFMRLNYFSNYGTSNHLQDIDFNDYMLWLFYFNNNESSYIKKIYSLAGIAAQNWNGDPKTNAKVIINVGKRQTDYRVFKDFNIRPDVNTTISKQTTELDKFLQEFTLSFKIGNYENVKIHIDFRLFKILRMVELGYRPNKKDNNNYVYFVNLINKLISYNNEEADLYIDEVNIGKPIDYKFSRDLFGTYTFKKIV